MSDDKKLKDNHDNMSDDDLYLKMVMLYQVEDPEAWEVAKHLRQRASLDKPRMTDVEHILNSPAPEKTKAEALLARIYDEGYADALRDQQKMIRKQIADRQADKEKADDALKDPNLDPQKASTLRASSNKAASEIASLKTNNDKIQQNILQKFAAAGKGVARVNPKGKNTR